MKRVTAAALVLLAGLMMAVPARAAMTANSAQAAAQKHNQEKSRKDMKRMRKEQKKLHRAQVKAARADKEKTASHT